MEIILILPILMSFILMVLILPKWIKKTRKIGLLWKDMNKYNSPKNVASSGGIVVVMSFVLGVLFYIAIRTFITTGDGMNLNMFSLLWLEVPMAN